MPLKHFWDDFLRWNEDRYDAYVGCHSGSCGDLPEFLKDKEVPLKPSKECSFGFVDAVNLLLQTAIDNSDSSQHPYDHFVLVSDNHMPLKSFDRVYDEFTTTKLSSFFWGEDPQGEEHRPFARVRMDKDSIQKAIEAKLKVFDRHINKFVLFNDMDEVGFYAKAKTSVWSTLTREHAELSVDTWNGSAENLKSFVTYCPDEEWFSLAIFGLIRLTDGMPVKETFSKMLCRTPTFTSWPNSKEFNPLDQMLFDDSDSKVSDNPGVSGTFERMSPNMMQKFKEKDDYFFAQKIADTLATDCDTRKMWNEVVLNRNLPNCNE